MIKHLTMRQMLTILICLTALARPALAEEVKLSTWQDGYYIVHSNLSKKEAKPYLDHMNLVYVEYYKRFSRALGKRLKADKENLYLFATHEDYMQHLGHHGINAAGSGGMFFRYPTIEGLATWTRDRDRDDVLGVLRHEGFHQFAHRFLDTRNTLPIWLNEGFAEYFEAALVVDKTFKTGIADAWRVGFLKQALADQKTMPFGKLINLSGQAWNNNVSSGSPMGHMQYAQSWSLVHFFLKGHDGKFEKRFNAYVRLISEGESSEEAFGKAFRVRGYGDLEDFWRAYIQEELQADAYAQALQRMRFIARGMRWLQKHGRYNQPTDLAALQESLSSLGYNMGFGHGDRLEATHAENFTYTDEAGDTHPFVLTDIQKGDLPGLSAPELNPLPTLEWTEDGGYLMTYEKVRRRRRK